MHFNSLSSIFTEVYTETLFISPLYPVEDDEASRIQIRHETLAERSVKHCAGCWEVETTRQCSHCRGSVFCSKNCEREMPLTHLLKCNMRQVTSADFLYEDVVVDIIPTDPQVRQDYWFERCHTKNEEPYLLGVFAGLVHYHPNHVAREELHRWRSDPGGNPYLVAKIIEKFEELPNNGRGAYFPWLLRPYTRFKLPAYHHSIPHAPYALTQVRNMQATARKYLAPEDQHKDVKELTPFAKVHCYCFYSMAVENLHPPPSNCFRLQN